MYIHIILYIYKLCIYSKAIIVKAVQKAMGLQPFENSILIVTSPNEFTLWIWNAFKVCLKTQLILNCDVRSTRCLNCKNTSVKNQELFFKKGALGNQHCCCYQIVFFIWFGIDYIRPYCDVKLHLWKGDFVASTHNVLHFISN